MFGILAALSSLPKERQGREALNYENYIRTGQGFPSNRIYRESSIDKQARKEVSILRRREQIHRQVKLIRLMKKLLIKIDHEIINENIDEEIEQMRRKVAQLEIKVEKAARAKDIDCEDMFDMEKSDDSYDIQLEEIIRNATLNMSVEKEILSKMTSDISDEKLKQDEQASGDHVNNRILNSTTNNLYAHVDHFLNKHTRKI